MHHTNVRPTFNEIAPNEWEGDVLFEPRGNPAAEKPYCWQSKTALRTIRACYGNDTRLLPYLMSTYLSLAEIASDEGRPDFTKTISEILSKAGGSDRKMRESLALLERLRLLHIKHNFVFRDTQKGKAPSTYTLLTVRHDTQHPPAQCAAPSGTEKIRSVPILIKNANAKNLKKRKNTHPSDAHLPSNANHQPQSSITKTTRSAKKEAELVAALNRIAAVGGRELAEAMQTKRRKRSEVLALTAMTDAHILNARGLLIQGWPLYRVKRYRPQRPK